jgi:hypothetical protein
MKLKRRLILTLAFTLVLFSGLLAQEEGNKKVVTETRELPAFHSVVVGGALNVHIQKSDVQEVRIETDENLQDNVKAKVENNTLFIKSNTLKNPTKLNAYIKVTDLRRIEASGATEVKGDALISTEELVIEASGATSVGLDLDVTNLSSSVSGAADVTLSGRADTHELDISGAGSLKAKGLVTRKTVYMASGASDASLNVTDELVGEKKGVATVKYTGNPSTTITSTGKKDEDEKYTVYSNNYYDSVKVRVGGIRVEVYEGDDSVRVIVGDRELRVDEDGNVRFRRSKVPKFNGHWAGFEMGFNGYLNTDWNQSFPKEYEYLDLRMTKSIAVNVNFFEQNVALAKNQKWGMVTGLGLEWHNYRFSKTTRLNGDSSQLIGYLDKGISIRKSKLTTLHLTVPVIMEFQTNSRHKKDSFHFGAGVVIGARLSSHTKKYYDERNKEFEITRYDPVTDNYLTEYTATSPNYSKAKDFDDFHMQPFKFDATVRIGWGFVNLYATYSINQMFKKDKGPELYPWTIGITFVNF